LNDRLSYDQLYREALSDPELKRTREELEAAMSNAREARKVVVFFPGGGIIVAKLLDLAWSCRCPLMLTIHFSLRCLEQTAHYPKLIGGFDDPISWNV
jgi:hypothetical protein